MDLIGHLDWVIGTLVLFGGAITGAVYAKTIRNSSRIEVLQILLGAMKSLPGAIGNYERRVDSKFDSIDRKLVDLAVDVAGIKAYTNNKDKS